MDVILEDRNVAFSGFGRNLPAFAVAEETCDLGFRPSNAIETWLGDMRDVRRSQMMPIHCRNTSKIKLKPIELGPHPS